MGNGVASAALVVVVLAALSLVGLIVQQSSVTQLHRSARPALHGLHELETWRQQFREEEPAGKSEILVRLRDVVARLERLERRGSGNATRTETRKGSRGKLVCDGKERDHEIVYWREIAADREYVAPTAAGGPWKDKYLSFEYDQGGWNNVRMGVECLVVVAHAMGRTLVVPPAQNLYLLGAPVEGKRKKLGFSDFFDLDLLKAHRGLPLVTMDEFLERQAHETPEKAPPRRSLWGAELWRYLAEVADAKPQWNGALLAMPRSFERGDQIVEPADLKVLQRYAGGRRIEYYEAETRAKRHVHVPAAGKHRLLQHHYSFAFVADPVQRSFYRRLIRDSMRYIDPIQCAGARLVDAVRTVSRDLGLGGAYYALHIRRGDFQYKEVKLSASRIVRNLRGTEIIPRGALVFVATDDPDGTCVHCRSQGKPCPRPAPGATQDDMPKGCPLDPSWDAFWRNGWQLVFSRNFTAVHSSNVAGALDASINPNYLGMAESIVCSRAEAFAGTWFSTFTGYIHRLRGFHGLAESTYYHSNGRTDAARSPDSYGRGYAREYRIGWTDDRGALI